MLCIRPAAGVGEACVQRARLPEGQPARAGGKREAACRPSMEQRQAALRRGPRGETGQPPPPAAASQQPAAVLPGRGQLAGRRTLQRAHLHPHRDSVRRGGVRGGPRGTSGGAPQAKRRVTATREPNIERPFGRRYELPSGRTGEGVAGLVRLQRTVRRRLPAGGLGHY